MRRIVLFTFAFFSFFSASYAATLDFFYDETCPHCQEEQRFFPELQEKFPALEISKFEIHNPENRALLDEKMAELQNESKNVPVNIINDKRVVIGFQKYDILCNLGDETACLEKKYEKWTEIGWPVMAFFLGLLDGFNPCAMWSLLMLLSFLLTLENKRQRWLIGGVFLATSGILYGGALLALLFGFDFILDFLGNGARQWFFQLVGVFALGAGIASLHAFWKNKVECEIRNPSDRRTFHQKLQTLLKRESLFLILPGVIILAFSVNAVELLCSVGIPTVFTANILSLPRPLQFTAIGIYDVAYMLDDIIVYLIAMFTLSLKIASPAFVRWSHLGAGVLLFIMGAFLIFNPSLLFFAA